MKIKEEINLELLNDYGYKRIEDWVNYPILKDGKLSGVPLYTKKICEGEYIDIFEDSREILIFKEHYHVCAREEDCKDLIEAGFIEKVR